jgi:hypothetical protein
MVLRWLINGRKWTIHLSRWVENGPAYTYPGLEMVCGISSNGFVCYLLTGVIGPPTQGHVYQKLVQAERIAELSGQSAVGNAQVVNIALDIERQQYV